MRRLFRGVGMRCGVALQLRPAAFGVEATVSPEADFRASAEAVDKAGVKAVNEC